MKELTECVQLVLASMAIGFFGVGVLIAWAFLWLGEEVVYE